VFVKDLNTGVLERVSVAANGQANGASLAGGISDNGRFVLFDSTATNLLVTDDTNGVSDVFVKDRVLGTVVRASTSSDVAQANGNSFAWGISGNGRYAIFSSDATNLVPNDFNGKADAFVKDLFTGLVARISVGADGGQSNANSIPDSISTDGKYITFRTDASNIQPGDTNGVSDVHVAINPLFDGQIDPFWGT
jgi:Tol biopolymer transport system component